MNTVDKMMETHRINDPMRMPRFFSSLALFITAMWQPSELYTWMLGQRFVGVSVL